MLSTVRSILTAIVILFPTISSSEEIVGTKKYHPPVCEDGVNDIVPLDESGDVFFILRCESHHFSPWNIPGQLLEQFEDFELVVDQERQVLYRWTLRFNNHSHGIVHIYTPYGIDVALEPKSAVETKLLSLPGVEYETSNFFLTVTLDGEEVVYTVTTSDEGIPSPMGDPLVVLERVSRVSY